MPDRKRVSAWLRMTTALAFAALLLTLAGAEGAAGDKPSDPGSKGRTGVVTLTGGPVTITAPGSGEGEVTDFEFSPESALTFTQQPGEVITVTMAAEFDVPNEESLFCDVHGAVNLARSDLAYDPNYTAMEQTFITQRGDVWWAMTHMGRDSTRTIPSPASPTQYTVIGVAWMDETDPDSPEDCYGNTTEDGTAHQDVDVSVRVSVVSIRS